MSKKNTDPKLSAAVKAWYPAQARLEETARAADAAREAAGAHARTLYELLGTKPFMCNGRKYRCIHKVGGRPLKSGNGVTNESWHVIPVAENAAENEFTI
jgi:hypothetical protein